MPLALHLNKALSKFASMSYNIYIVHQFILIGLLANTKSQLLTLREYTPWLFPFLLFIIVFTLSTLISLCFTKLPVLKNYRLLMTPHIPHLTNDFTNIQVNCVSFVWEVSKYNIRY